MAHKIYHCYNSKVQPIKYIVSLRNSTKHHYCPVFYLKGFTNSSKNLCSFDKEKKYKPYNETVPPKSIMFEAEMNTILLPNGEKDSSIEDVYFKKLDSNWAPTIKYLQETIEIASLSKKHLTTLLGFLSWQYVRSPFFIQEIAAQYPHANKLDNFLKRLSYQSDLQEVFFTKKLIFHFINDDSEFLTSDNPCFLYTNYPVQFMPLTKKILLSWENDTKLVLQKSYVDEKFVEITNNLIVSDAKKYVVGSNKKNIVQSVEATKNHPGFLEKIQT